MQGHVHKRVRTDRRGEESVRWYVVVDLGFGDDGRRTAEVARRLLPHDERPKSSAPSWSRSSTAAPMSLPRRITLSEWIRGSWLSITERRVKPSTFHSYRANLELHVLPTLGRRPLQQLTPPMLNALYEQLASEREDRKALSAKTISYIHSTLHKVLADAVDAGLLGRNPATAAKPPRPARRGALKGSERGSPRSWRDFCM